MAPACRGLERAALAFVLRTWLVPLLRLAFHLQPSERSATASIAGLMLRSAAQPGPAGAALDALRILLGTRLLPTTLVTLLFPLPGPLLAVAAVHAASVGLTVNNAAYCAAPLLSNPLTRQRLRWLATAMHTASAFGEPLWFMQGPARA
ncbi:hypothetical protein ABPG77_009606 [Micractinium sp. CCAP 211/92]